MKRLLLVAMMSVPLGGCIGLVPLRGSSLDVLRDSESRVVLPAKEPEVVEALSSLLAARGFVRTDKRELNNEITYYIYKGKRREVRDVRGGGGTMPIVTESHELGSWFVARVFGGGPTTEVLLIGKPSVDNVEICADSDQILAEAAYWCRNTSVRSDYPAQNLHGGQEAETVRGVLTSIKEKYGLR
ncbi:MAG: hypothetical protein ABI321_15655 [Polyangia bacterium]